MGLALKCSHLCTEVILSIMDFVEYIAFFSCKKRHFSMCSAPVSLHKLSCPPLFIQRLWDYPKLSVPFGTRQPFALQGCGEARMTAAVCEHAVVTHPGFWPCTLCTRRRRESFVGAGRQQRKRRVFAEAVINSSWGKSWELGERLCLLVKFSNTPLPPHRQNRPGWTGYQSFLSL